MRELNVSYTELKLTTKKMYLLVYEMYGFDKKINLKTAFYQDLGVFEDDWDIFLENYEKEFNCYLEGLKYNEYFIELNEVNVLRNIFYFLLSPLYLINCKFTKQLKKSFSPVIKLKSRLTIGDLILSAIAKKFVKREQTQINILYKN